MATLRSPLRTTLRNSSSGSRSALILSTLVLTACARLADLEPVVDGNGAQTGSAAPDTEIPVDTTLPAAPPRDCGDVASSATNCGFCGHDCNGGTCDNGLCSEQTIARRTNIESFVTNGTSVYAIENGAPIVCSVAGPADQSCAPIVESGDVHVRRLAALPPADDDDDGYGGGWYGQGGGNGGGQGGGNGGGGNGGGGGGQGITATTSLPVPLRAKAITLFADRVLIAEDAYRAIVSCPVQGACNAATLGLVDATSTDALGVGLAGGPTGVTWTQGTKLVAALLPPSGQNTMTHVSREEPNARKVLSPAGVFWLSDQGLQHATAVSEGTAPELWFRSNETSDFTVDAKSVYVASKTGLFRVARADKKLSIATGGHISRVAAAEDGEVYAAVLSNEGVVVKTTISIVRAQALLPIAVVDGTIDALTTSGAHVYYSTRVDDVTEIRRVPR